MLTASTPADLPIAETTHRHRFLSGSDRVKIGGQTPNETVDSP